MLMYDQTGDPRVTLYHYSEGVHDRARATPPLVATDMAIFITAVAGGAARDGAGAFCGADELPEDCDPRPRLVYCADMDPGRWAAPLNSPVAYLPGVIAAVQPH